MRLSQKALNAISDPQSRMRIAMALGVSDPTIIRYLKNNDDELTKAAAMVVIRQITGFDDEQILEVEAAEKSAN
jgi:adenosine/AMP kinase